MRLKPKSMQDIETVTLMLEINEDSPISFLKETQASIAKDGTFSYASTVAFSESIYLRAIPQRAFPVLVDNIEQILVHEQIHLALYALFDDDTSSKFDNLFPVLNDLERWVREHD